MLLRRLPLLLATLALVTAAHTQTLLPFPGPDGRYGFADREGRVVTPPQFKKAWLPDENGVVLGLDDQDRLHAIRQDGAVLPGAVYWKAWTDPVIYPVLDGTDTLPDLRCVRSSDNQDLLLLRNGPNGWESRLFLGSGKLQSMVTIHGNNRPEGYNSAFLFYNGLARRIKGERSLNFTNTRLEDVFTTDFENGAVLINGHFALAAPDGRFALGDERGRILTPFQFRNIIGTPRKGFFVVNYLPGQSGHRVGLLRTDGSLAIDTIYHELKGATENVLVAGHNARYGLLNYAGDTVLPFTYTHLEYTRGDFFIAGNEQGLVIIDSNGEPLWDKPQRTIQFVPGYYPGDPVYFTLQENNATKFTTVLDANLQFLFADTLSSVRRQARHFTVSAKGERHHGIYSYAGKPLVPMIFHSIKWLEGPHGFLVEKDSLFGLYTPDGREALPCRYTRIVPERGYGDTLILWANPHRDKNLYTAFDPEGRRLPFPELIAPTLRALDLKNCFAPEMDKGRWKLTLPDGSFIYKPHDYPNNNRNVGTPDGCVMVECADGRCDVLSPFFKSILPAGFYIPQDRYRGPYIQMGLIPVYNDKGQSGIINTRGEWVQKPGPFQYHILRSDLYSEHKGQPLPEHMEGITICKITPEGVQRTEVHYMDDQFREGHLMIGRLFDDAPEEIRQKYWYGGKVRKYAVMDTLGRVITPFILQRPPLRIYTRWTANVFTPDYQTKTVVFDDRGKILFDFGDERIEGYDPERHWVYFSTEDHFTGIRDTLGREILPAKFREINWRVPGRLFTHKLSDTEQQLCDAKGNPVLTGFRYIFNSREIRDGYCFVVSMADDYTHTCHILSPDNRVLCALPGKDIEVVERFPHLIKVETEERQVRYVDFRNGTVFGG